MIIPDTHDEYDTLIETGAHARETSERLEMVGITKDTLLLRTELGADAACCRDARDHCNAVLYDDAVLHIQSPDLREGAGSGAGAGYELRHDSHLLGRVERVGGAGPVEVAVAETVAVEVASVLIAHTLIALIIVAALGSGTSRLPDHAARVRCERGADAVGFPDIHFGATRSVSSSSGVDVISAVPVENVGLTGVSLRPEEKMVKRG